MGAFGYAEPLVTVADQVYEAFQIDAIYLDFNDIAIEHLADGATGQGFGRDVADAGTGGYAAEAGIGEHRDVLAEFQVLQRGGDLISLFHAGAHGAAADEHDDVAGGDAAGAVAFDGGDGGGFGLENA